MLESLLKIETKLKGHSEVAKVQPMASPILGVSIGDTDPNRGRQII